MAKPKTPLFAQLDVDAIKATAEPILEEAPLDTDGSGAMPDTFIYSSQEAYNTHLFELKTSKVLKNIGLHTSPDYRTLDHQHFFRTVDSNGYEQTKSTATGGHFHVITISEDNKTLTCSPAMTEKSVFDKKERKWKKEYQAVTVAGREDNHVHKIQYVRTDEIKKRKLNEQAAKFIAQESVKVQPVEGIIG
jgi:hypothetical protein